MFICKYCGREFLKKFACTQHELYNCQNNPDKKQKNFTKKYTNHHKTICKYCGKEFDVANISRHEAACANPNSKLNMKKNIVSISHDGLNCIYCGKECKNKNSLAQHEIRCKENPNRKDFDNHSLVNYIANFRKGKTKLNCEEIARAANTLHARYSSGELSRANTGCSFGYKFGWYKDIWCDSSWELAFLIYNLEHNKNITRNSIGFKYKDNIGNFHTYYPDFIIDDTIYEIKGIYSDEVALKINAVKAIGRSIELIDKTAIQKYLDYCIKKYGKEFYNLYDTDKPSWKTVY